MAHIELVLSIVDERNLTLLVALLVLFVLVYFPYLFIYKIENTS